MSDFQTGGGFSELTFSIAHLFHRHFVMSNIGYELDGKTFTDLQWHN